MTYTVGGIVLPAITPFNHVADLGIIPAGNYTVTANGILNGAVSSTMGASLNVIQCCGANSAFSANETNVCIGEAIHLTNTSTGITSQIWYENNVQVSTNTDYSTTAMTTGSLIYKLVVTDGICSDSVEYTVNVYDAPVINSITPSAQTVCVGESITFSGNATGAFSYSWYKDNVFAGSGNNFTTTAIGAGPHIYSLIVLSACADTMDITVQFLAPPSFDTFTVSDDSICLGGTVSFTSTTTGSTVETWYENGALIGTGNDINATPLLSGMYSYNLTITDGICSDSTVQTVQVFDLPVVDLGADTNSCLGSITLDAGAGMASYQWQDLSTSQTLVADSGTYYVTVTDLNGCQATDTIEIATCASLNELDSDWIKVSPNPTRTFVTFSFDAIHSGLEIYVLDVFGRTVLETEVNNENSIQLDFTEFESGTYFVQFIGDGVSSIVKVVRE